MKQNKQSIRENVWPVTMATLVFIAASAIVIVFNQGINQRFQLEERQRIESLVSAHRTALEYGLFHRLNVAYSMAAFAAHDPTGFEATFEKFAQKIYSFIPNVRSIQVAPNAKVILVYPIAGNEAAMGHDLLNDPNRRADVLRTIERADLTLAGPLELVQGGQALIARIPIFVDKAPWQPVIQTEHGQFWGLGIVVIDIPPLLTEAGIIQNNGGNLMAIRVASEDGTLHPAFFGDDALFHEEDTVRESIVLPDGNWELAARPVSGWAASMPGFTFFIVGEEMMALALGWVTFTLIRAPLSLRQKVRERTRELASTNQQIMQEIAQRVQTEAALQESRLQLDGIIASAMDAIITIDTDQRIILYNNAAERMFYHTVDEVVGQPLDRLIPEQFRQAHRENVLAFEHDGTTRRSMGKLRVVYGLRGDGTEFPLEASISRFTVSDRTFFTVILRDITLRVQTEQAIQRHTKRLEGIHSIDRAILEGNTPAKIIHDALFHLCNLLNCNSGTIFLLDLENRQVQLTTIGVDPKSTSTEDTTYSLDFLPSLNTLKQKTEITDSGEIAITTGLDEYLSSKGIRSFIRIPLIVEGKLIGALQLNADQPDFFSPEMAESVQEVSDQLAIALNHAHLYEALESSYLQAVLALANAMDSRDAYTGDHSQRLSKWAEAVAKKMGSSSEMIRTVRWAGLLHDIGKIGVSDNILNKPGPLTEAEWEVMKRHPEIGADIIAPIESLKGVAEIVRTHQERYDGSGYPDGLQGDSIPLGARILAVVDAYGAMIDERIYRPARSQGEAIAELKRCAGTHFDPQIVDVFLQILP